MAYVPINLQIFSAAYAGAMAAFGSSSYADAVMPPFGLEATVGLAFAQAVDTQWNNASVPTTFDVETMFDAALILMRDRGPFPATTPITNVSNWTASANQIVSSILAGEIAANSAGITFPPWTPSAGPSGPSYIQGGNTFGALATLGTTDNFDQRFIINGLEALHLTRAAGAVNFWNLTQSATGNALGIAPSGTDANISITYSTKGTGTHVFRPGTDSLTAFQVAKAGAGAVIFSVDSTNGRVGIGNAAPASALDVTGTVNASISFVVPLSGNVTTVQLRDQNGNNWLEASAALNAVNDFRITNAATGNPVIFEAVGGDPNIGIKYRSRGTGIMSFRQGTDTTTAFQITKADDATVIFSVDSTNRRIGINNAAPTSALDVTGSINASVQVVLPLSGSVITVQLRDTNNNNWLEATGAVNAVNNFKMTNAATGSPVILEAVGGDPNIGIKYRSRGTGIMSFRQGTDTTTAFQITKADDATVIFSVDSTNRRIGINNAAPGFDLDVTGVGRFTTAAQVQTLRDTNGNAWLTATTTATAVNNINITDAATGNGPTLSAVGTDGNVSINYLTKGTGTHVFRPGTDSITGFQVSKAGAGANVFDVDTTNARVGINQAAPSFDLDVTGVIRATTGVQAQTMRDTNGNAWLTAVTTATAVNNFEITNKATGSGPIISAVGTDTNIAFNFFTKGTGSFIFSRNGADGTGAFQVRNNAAARILDVDTTNGRVGCFGAGAVSQTPFSALSVEDSVSGAGPFICDMNNIKSGTTTNNVLELQGGNNTGVGSSDIVSFLRPDGNQIGHIVQNAAGTVQYLTSSDRRLKKDIKPTERGLDVLNRVKVRDYTWKKDKKKEQGFIAQELIKLYPEAVSRGKRPTSRGRGKGKRITPWSVDYGRLTPLLVQSVQELSAEVKRLQSEVKRLQKAGK